MYAWYPPGHVLGRRILNTLYATLLSPRHSENDKQEHRTLVETFVGKLPQYKHTLMLYFGMSQGLGEVRLVTYHSTQEGNSIDFYHLPTSLTCYTWQGLFL
jgi:hypothetical protein